MGLVDILYDLSNNSGFWEDVLDYLQGKCEHQAFTYDSDTDVSYCDDCGKSLYPGDLMEELMFDAGITERDDNECYF